VCSVEKVQVLIDRKSELVESANGRLKAMRGLYSWASSKAAGHMKSNPAKAVDYLKSDNPDGFYTWTIADVEQFKGRHPVAAILIMPCSAGVGRVGSARAGAAE
jgi:hypothetical protein